MRCSSPLWALAITACGTPKTGEPWEDWFDQGSAYDVEEPIEFTDVNYDFTGPDSISSVPWPDEDQTWFSPDDPRRPSSAAIGSPTRCSPLRSRGS